MHKSFCRPFIAAPAKQYSSALLKRFLAAGANWLPTVFALSSGRGKSGAPAGNTEDLCFDLFSPRSCCN
eukprot:m.116729 g.116729  ORF g.116729 m.116729 type:complete len:69 (+) comp37582_c0_seq26:2-208(+)